VEMGRRQSFFSASLFSVPSFVLFSYFYIIFCFNFLLLDANKMSLFVCLFCLYPPQLGIC